MQICLVGKYPPIQGGVSARNFWITRWLAANGHSIDVVTNAEEVQAGYRIRLFQGDAEQLAPRFEHGAVRVWATEPHGPRARHIPDHNPFVTKLTSLAIAAIEASSADVVLGVYLEPYALAAYLAATLTNRPLALRHAGSDVGRLLKQPQLGPCYERILRNANLVCGSPSTLDQFSQIGVPAESLHPDPGFAVPNEVFHSEATPLDVDRLLGTLAAEAGVPAAGPFAPVDSELPTIGIYGKIGAAKGSYDLVAALGDLKRRGRRFNFLAMCGGDPAGIARFSEAIVEADIEAETRRLPFLAHWHVPGFLRTLTAACFLEHRFPIAAHGPGIPQEVLSVGVPLITTVEIARKQSFAPALVHGRNVLIVHDPSDHAELAGVLDHVITQASDLAELGREGRRCVPPSDVEGCVARYEAMLERAVSARRPPTATAPHSPVDAVPTKRETSAWRFFPASRRLLGAAAESIEHPDTDADGYLQALRLCDACAEHWQAFSSTLPHYTGEVLRFELHQVPDPEKANDADALLFREPAADPPAGVTALAPNVTLRRFDHDMDALTRSLESDRDAPADWPDEPSYYVFQHLPGRHRNRVLRVSPAVYRFLASIDGRTPMDLLQRRASEEGGTIGNEASEGAISKLLRDGIIVTAPVGADGAS